jgi:hypothetical protein
MNGVLAIYYLASCLYLANRLSPGVSAINMDVLMSMFPSKLATSRAPSNTPHCTQRHID